MSIPQPIHPFPARMAPTIALEHVRELPPASVVLDPMMGSGVVVRVASDTGHRAIGRDIDPLAVLMSRVWTTPINTQNLVAHAEDLVEKARILKEGNIVLPWIDEDAETRQFLEYWFAPAQREQLRRLSAILYGSHTPESDALRVALSKTIITKDHGASLARDVSHSRPHRAFDTNFYDVYSGFLQAVRRLARRFEQEPPRGNTHVELGDARRLNLDDGSINAVITSPPYLNAIDYLRGHRLALVWLGHQVRALRLIRANSIGAERAPDPGADTTLASRVIRTMRITNQFPPRQRRLLERYIIDLAAMLGEIHRVLKPGGRAVLVIGNSCIRGFFIPNSDAVVVLAREIGLVLDNHTARSLPDSRRYLPPPTINGGGSIERRMREEVVLSFIRR